MGTSRHLSRSELDPVVPWAPFQGRVHCKQGRTRFVRVLVVHRVDVSGWHLWSDTRLAGILRPHSTGQGARAPHLNDEEHTAVVVAIASALAAAGLLVAPHVHIGPEALASVFGVIVAAVVTLMVMLVVRSKFWCKVVVDTTSPLHQAYLAALSLERDATLAANVVDAAQIRYGLMLGLWTLCAMWSATTTPLGRAEAHEAADLFLGQVNTVRERLDRALAQYARRADMEPRALLPRLASPGLDAALTVLADAERSLTLDA